MEYDIGYEMGWKVVTADRLSISTNCGLSDRLGPLVRKYKKGSVLFADVRTVGLTYFRDIAFATAFRNGFSEEPLIIKVMPMIRPNHIRRWVFLNLYFSNYKNILGEEYSSIYPGEEEYWPTPEGTMACHILKVIT